MIPTHQAARYMERAHRAGFIVFPGYVAYSAKQLAEKANGVGPESWRQWMRDLLGAALSILMPYVDIDPAAFVHDVWGSLYNDGTREGFKAWNAAFAENIKRDAYLDIRPWRFLARRAVRRGASLAHAAVDSEAGWKAWRDAYEARVSSEFTPGQEVDG